VVHDTISAASHQAATVGRGDDPEEYFDDSM
jgi:hypothetical protein